MTSPSPEFTRYERKKTELEAVIAKTETELAKRPAAFPHLLVTSSREGLGIPELRATIAGLIPNGVEP